MNLQKTAYLLLSGICLVIALIYGQSILMPFVLGVLLWFIGRELKASLNRIGFVKNKFPEWIKNILSVAIIVGLLAIIAEVLTTNINFLAHSLDKYQPNIDSIINKASEFTGVDLKARTKGYSGNFDFGGILRALFASLTNIISNSFMIILYAVFVLLEESHFKPKLKAIFTKKGQSDRVDLLLDRIGNSISRYFRLKTLVSLTTGILSYFALKIIGVDAAEFWAFLIFILNFIPTIGSLIGTIFPAVFCLFQFGTFLEGILVLSIVGAIQVFVGNFLEPKLMGSSMNISPLVTILSLSIWGAMWGITGMILSVPIAVVTIIILSQFEKTRGVAVMLSEKGAV